jgi:hypothetical protein
VTLSDFNTLLKRLYAAEDRVQQLAARIAVPWFQVEKAMHFAGFKQHGTDRKLHIHRNMVIAVEEWAPQRARVFLDEEYNTALNEQGIQTPLIVEASAEEVFKLLSNAPFWGVDSSS